MRYILIIFILLAVSANAGDVTIESLAPTDATDLTIASGDTVRIIDNWQAGDGVTTCNSITVNAGGYLIWTGGARANIPTVTVSGFMKMSASDTLEIGTSGVLDITSTGSVTIDGVSATTRAVIYSLDPANMGYITANDATAYLDAQYCKFYRLSAGSDAGGLTLGASGQNRNNDDGIIQNCVMDSCSITHYGEDSYPIKSCSLLVTYDWDSPPINIYGHADTVSIHLVHNQNSQVSAHNIGNGFIQIYANKSTLLNSTATNINVNGEGGRGEYGVRIRGDSILVRGCTLDGFVWNMFSNLGTFDVVIDSNIIINAAHEGCLRNENSHDSAWTYSRNIYYGNGWETDSKYAALLLNFGPDEDAKNYGYKIYYNTFCQSDTGDIPLEFRNHVSGDITISGFDIVGNIFVGAKTGRGSDLYDIRVGNYGGATIQVVCDDFKKNAYDNLTIDVGCSFGIAGSAYTYTDSNLTSQTAYDFVDSVNFDLRLYGSTPLKGQGDNTVYASLYATPKDSSFIIQDYWGDGLDDTLMGTPGYFQVPFAPMSPNDSGPSPLSQQLHIGQTVYNSETIWQNNANRDLYANRYSYGLYDIDVDPTTYDIQGDADSMKIINPDIKAILYTMFSARQTNAAVGQHKMDSVDVDTICTNLSLTKQDLFYTIADDSVLRFNSDGGGLDDHQGAGDTILLYNDIVGIKRLTLDARNPNVGSMFGNFYWVWVDSFHFDGLMWDEEATMWATGNPNSTWFERQQYPFRDPARWDTSGTYANWWVGITNQWSTDLTFDQICDSVAILRDGWQKRLRDTLNAHGYEYSVNWSSVASPQDTTLDQINWENEARHATVRNIGAAFVGEFCAYNPSRPKRWANGTGATSEKDINAFVSAMSFIADSSINLYVEGFSIGSYDFRLSASDSMLYPRTRMNALGMMLEATWDGNSVVSFGPHSHYPNLLGADNDWDVSHSVTNYWHGAIVVNDIDQDWSGAWGKFFGEPATAANRDSSQTGTDGDGATYTVHKLAMLKPNTSDTLTWAVGRYCRGANRAIQLTEVSVNMPAGVWYELDDYGFWSIHKYDTVYIANAQWRIFSSDPAMSDTFWYQGLTSVNVTTNLTNQTETTVDIIYLVTGSDSASVDSVVWYGGEAATDTTTRLGVSTQIPADTMNITGLTGTDYWARNIAWWVSDAVDVSDTSASVHIVLPSGAAEPQPVVYKGGYYKGGIYR